MNQDWLLNIDYNPMGYCYILDSGKPVNAYGYYHETYQEALEHGLKWFGILVLEYGGAA